MYPKVLVIANNPFSLTSNNGKTYYSFFKGWPKDRIAQIFFSNEEPLWSLTNNYFNFYKHLEKSEKNSETLEPSLSQQSKLNLIKNTIILNLKTSSMGGLLHNSYWLIKNHLKKKELDTFIQQFGPDVIFFVGGRSSFSYVLLNQIYEKYQIPYCIYYTDDYFIPENKKAITLLNHRLFINQAKIAINNACKLFVISEKMKKEYQIMFNKDCYPIMNSINFSDYESKVYTKPEDNLSFAYFGGLHLRRLDSIKIVAEQIEIYNKNFGTNFSVNIYSATVLTSDQQKAFNTIACLNYKGQVSNEEIIDEMCKHDVMLFIESFDKDMINRTRLSLSTKVPEYLAIGKPIFAIGPSDSGSIDYLKHLNGTYVVDNEDSKNIYDMVDKINKSRDKFRDIYVTNREYVNKYHSYGYTHNLLRRELSACLK